MRTSKILTVLAFAAGCLLGATALAPPAAAHSQLGTPLKKRYNLRTISCTACHDKEVKEKSKEALTAFGKEIAKLLEGKMVSERIASVKGKPREEREKVLDEIEKEYLEVLDKLDKMTAPSGKPYAEALPAGEIEGTRPR